MTDTGGAPPDLETALAGIDAMQERLDFAERAVLMFSWCGARHETDRDKAAHELWAEWHDRYGDAADARHRADLSDEYIAELARKRDETRARTLAKLGMLET